MALSATKTGNKQQATDIESATMSHFVTKNCQNSSLLARNRQKKQFGTLFAL